jgi:hypothetical protein
MAYRRQHGENEISAAAKIEKNEMKRKKEKSIEMKWKYGEKAYGEM